MVQMINDTTGKKKHPQLFFVETETNDSSFTESYEVLNLSGKKLTDIVAIRRTLEVEFVSHSTTPIVLRNCSPEIIDISFVLLPTIDESVDETIQKFISNENSLILALTPGKKLK